MSNLLADDHSELAELLDKLFAAFDTENAGQIHRSLDIFWARLAMHIRAEHLHLFPAVLTALEQRENENTAVSRDTAQKTVARLREDHDFFMHELAALMKRLRVLKTGQASDLSVQLSSLREKLAAVGRRLETHNELEESGFYQWAEAFLDRAERAALNERMQKELDNLPPRFSGY